MAPKLWVFVLLSVYFISGFPVITAYIDPSNKMMEDFSGYPIHEPRSQDSLLSLSVDSEGLQKQIDELSTLSDTPAPSVTRILYSEKDVLARRFIKNLMGLSGLSVREDAVGNIFGRWDGYEPELAPVSTGSHIDAIPYSGKYDGVVGVLGAIEAINVLKRSGFKPKRSLEVIMFTSEEPTRFGISCLGSRLLAGSKELAELLEKTVDGQNISFFDAARSAEYANHPDNLTSVFLKKGSYSAFIELHIEQGPILEEEATSIGVVTAIAAPASIKVDFEGNGGHAGAVLMPMRNDAGLAAAELALAVEKFVLQSGSIDTVGTVGVGRVFIFKEYIGHPYFALIHPNFLRYIEKHEGHVILRDTETERHERKPSGVDADLTLRVDHCILELHPGAINSIPSKSHMEIDTRDIDEKRRNVVIEKIHQSALSISKSRGVKLSEFKIVNQDPPALAGDLITTATESACQELNLTYKKMISRAYHDSLFMARISPMGMIFIPCYKGYSHKPEEFAAIDDIANGVRVLALTLAKLSLV